MTMSMTRAPLLKSTLNKLTLESSYRSRFAYLETAQSFNGNIYRQRPWCCCVSLCYSRPLPRSRNLDLDLDLHLTRSNYSQKICIGAESSQIYPDMDLDIDLDRKFVFVFICNYLVAAVISIFSESTEISGFCLSWG